MLLAEVRQAIEKVDLGEGDKFLDEEFGVRTACAWVQYKFGTAARPDEVKTLERRRRSTSWSAAPRPQPTTKKKPNIR